MATVNIINKCNKLFFPILSPQKVFVLNSSSALLLRSVHASSGNGESKPSGFYDVIIAGGGMVGTTLACCLGQNPKLSQKKILLLEGCPEQHWKLSEQYSNRVVALNPSTKSLLTSIGAWKHITDARCQAVKKMQVWEALSDALITFHHDDMSHDIAYIVENDVLLNAVDTQVRQLSANVAVVHGAKIRGYQLPRRDGASSNIGNVGVDMEDGSAYTCSLLIGADGANSQVRRAMGVHYLTWKYDQMGVVATLRLSEPTENVVAWQRFLPTGPIALLPLTDELSSLVWSTSTEQARQLLQLSDEGFVDALNEALWKQHPKNAAVESATRFLNGLLDVAMLSSCAVRQLQPSVAAVVEKSRAAFPLAFGHSSRYVDLGVALVGDAAHRVHPLAGQGVNLGFGDVECLSEMLGEAVYSGQGIGSLSSLLKYETLRQRHNIPTMLAIDGLQKLYSSNCTPLVVLRSLGLQLTHALTPVKKVIMSHAAV